MSEQIQPALSGENESVDTRALTRQLGSAEELTTLGPIACSHQLTKIHSLPALRDFLTEYRDTLLAPREYRQIYNACNYGVNNFTRELLALDQQLSQETTLREFSVASRHVGKRQLNRMRTLKDLRTIQRYREAVNAGEAYGWHTLVYGLVLSTYSIPLRQGLLHYGRQTLRGFIESASRSLDLSEGACLELQHEMDGSLPPLIEETLGPNGTGLKVLP